MTLRVVAAGVAMGISGSLAASLSWSLLLLSLSPSSRVRSMASTKASLSIDPATRRFRLRSRSSATAGALLLLVVLWRRPVDGPTGVWKRDACANGDDVVDDSALCVVDALVLLLKAGARRVCGVDALSAAAPDAMDGVRNGWDIATRACVVCAMSYERRALLWCSVGAALARLLACASVGRSRRLAH